MSESYVIRIQGALSNLTIERTTCEEREAWGPQLQPGFDADAVSVGIKAEFPVFGPVEGHLDIRLRVDSPASRATSFSETDVDEDSVGGGEDASQQIAYT